MMKKIIKIALGVATSASAAAALMLAGCNDKTENSSGGNTEPDGRTVYSVTVEGGEGGGRYYEDDIVEVIATVPEGKEFLKWTVDGEAVSANENYTFTVTGDVTVIAEFKDADIYAGKKAFDVTVITGSGSGTYAEGGNCTAILAKSEAGRSFKGWAEVDSNGETGEILSEEITYTFKVTKSVTITALFNDVRLETPTNEVFTFRNPGYANWVIELDRMKVDGNPKNTAESNRKTAFVTGVDYILCLVYDSETASKPVGSFKFMQTDGGATLLTFDGAAEFELSGTAGNYYRDWVWNNDWYPFLRAAVGENYDAHSPYYIATQLIAKTEPVEIDGEGNTRLYADSGISPRTANFFREDSTAVIKTYTVKVEGGTLDNGESECEYAEGEYCTIIADEAPEGKRFVAWTVGGEEFTGTNPYTFIVNANLTFTAKYAELGNQTVLVSVDGGTVLTADGEASSAKVTAGTEVTLKAGETPAGQEFAYWYYVDENKNEVKLSDEEEFTFVATQTVKIRAAFSVFYSATINYVDKNGNPLDIPETVIHKLYLDENYTIEAEVPEGYGFIELRNESGETVSTFYKYSYKIENNRTFTAVLGNELVYLETPENGNNQMIKVEVRGDYTLIEVDRQKKDGNSGNTAESNRKTAFVEGVDHILFYMYDESGKLAGNFKLEQTVKGADARLITMDGSKQLSVGSSAGNYYKDWTPVNEFYAFFKAVAGDSYNQYMGYYFAAQVVGVEKSIYVSSEISAIGTNRLKQSVKQSKLTVENGNGSGNYEAYTFVTVSANVPEGMRFAGWTAGGEVVSTEENYKFLLEEDLTLTANFVTVYSVTVDGGSVNGQTHLTVDAGEEITVKADEGDFLYWIVNDDLENKIYDKEYSFAVDGNVTIKAIFDVSVRVSVEGGTFENGETSVDARAGDYVTVIPNASDRDGYKFRYWYYLDGQTEVKLSEEREFTFLVAVERTVIAKFERYYTVTVENGYIGGDEQLKTAEIWAGESVTVTAEEPEGFGFVQWKLNGEKVDGAKWQYEFTPEENAALAAEVGEKVKFETPENGNNQMIKFNANGSYNLVELDRLGNTTDGSKNPDGAAKLTVFTEGVDYLLIYMYDGSGKVVGSFKYVYVEHYTYAGVDCTTKLVTMDGSVELAIKGRMGNGYQDQAPASEFFGFFKAVLGENCVIGAKYYFAAQLIAEEHTVYADSEVSVIGTSALTMYDK